MGKNFTTSITVDATAQEVYNAINNVGGWWHGEVIGNTTKVNDEFSYWFQHFHFSKQRVTELVPNKKIVWLVTESNLSFTKKPSEWTGTKIVFELTETDDKTQVSFTHEGLVPAFECYGDCSNGWSMLIQQSLYGLITKGKGVAVF
ncbi:MAG: SRPBCC domain-containing protein [Bacteroidetes bacterium]|nr:SRPBCC domain-containing protein [Bacteroidota bacterium]